MHTEQGKEMLHNFVYNVCACKGDWKMDSFVKTTIEELKAKIGTGKALCALSGGVDSSVAAVLLSKAIGKQLTCVFVDHGLLRKDEGDQVESVFGSEGPYDLNFIRVNAKDRFYEKLKGVTEPEKKRKIIGEEFIRVFEEEAKKIGAVDYLVQGTICRMSLRAASASRPSSRATTMSAACPTSSTSRRLSSRCACFSRMKCAPSAASSACLSTS